MWMNNCPTRSLQVDFQLDFQLLSMGFVGIGSEKFTKKSDPARRVGDDTLDWTNQAQVLRAYLAALPPDVTVDQHEAKTKAKIPPGDHVTIPWHFRMAAIADLVCAMQLFKMRCPKAMTWVEAKVEITMVLLEYEVGEEVEVESSTGRSARG